MKPHEERVITEKQELDEKIAKLKAFVIDPVSPVFKGLPETDQRLLVDQLQAMRRYSEVLNFRIERFSK